MPSWVVAGASRGIGLEFVRQLQLDKGNTIFAIIRQESTSEKLLELAKDAPNVHVIEADLGDPKAIKAAAQKVQEITGGFLDYLIYNAAYLNRTALLLTLDTYPDDDTLENELNKSMKVNVNGPIRTINAFLPLLQNGSAKKVVALSSLAVCDDITRAGYAAFAPYALSKAALNMAIAKYAARLKNEGFTFIALSPGIVESRNQSDPLPPQEYIDAIMHTMACFRTVYPDWDGKPLVPEQSVKMMLDVIARVTPDDSGVFLSHHGNDRFL